MALLAAKFHGDIGKALVLDAAAVLRLLQATDALRRPARFVQLLEVCALDTHGAALAPYPPAPRLVTALAAARAVDAGTIAREARDSEQIRERVTQARLTAIQQALDASEAGARNNPLKGAPLL